MQSGKFHLIHRNLYGTGFSYLWHGFVIALKIWLFENVNWLYLKLFRALTAESLKDSYPKDEKTALVK
jgi:hypothetical protein